MVEDGQSDKCLPDPASANERDGRDTFCQINSLVDQLVASETDPRRPGRRLSGYPGCGYKILDLIVVGVADLVSV